ncbi:MAG: hypothetical protein U0T79_09340 [Ferruginibacter sp.]
MPKYFLWTLLFFSCHSNSDTESHLKASPVSDTTSVLTAEKKSSELNKTTKSFDNKQSFEIISFTNSVYRHTTDTDTTKCSHWTLDKSAIEIIIKNSEPIDGTTWDLSFLVLACTKTVNVVQSGQKFKVELNAGSFFWVNNGDTSVLFGDYKKSDRKYFIEAPDNN